MWKTLYIGCKQLTSVLLGVYSADFVSQNVASMCDYVSQPFIKGLQSRISMGSHFQGLGQVRMQCVQAHENTFTLKILKLYFAKKNKNRNIACRRVETYSVFHITNLLIPGATLCKRNHNNFQVLLFVLQKLRKQHKKRIIKLSVKI